MTVRVVARRPNGNLFDEPMSCEVRLGRHGAARTPCGLILPRGQRIAVGDHPLAVVIAREVERHWREDQP